MFIRDHNSAPAFQQRHTVSDETLFLYKLERNLWAVGRTLGSEDYVLKCTTTTTSLPSPSETWQYRKLGGDKWISDPGLKMRRGELPPCQTIRVEVRGAAGGAQSECAGDYSPTGDWCRGLQVFKHHQSKLYLSVWWWWWGRWYISDRPGGGNLRVWSGASAWCPADPRAVISQSDNTKSWRYWDSDGYRIEGEEGDIKVKCSVHSWPAGAAQCGVEWLEVWCIIT